jgi:hypothetical protein
MSMAQVTIILTDTPSGGVAIHTNFEPAIGAPCSNAQSAALDIISRTKRDWGLIEHKAPLLAEVDIDAVHRTRDRVMPDAGKALK